jgi:hypothetical protein
MDDRTKLNTKAIQDQLRVLEKERQLTVLFAVESGSRMWGFPSTDSDYDVRFIYVKPQMWYISSPFLRKGDPNSMDSVTHFVTNPETKDVLDFHGWDLVKAVSLVQRSNPALHEWLQSPITYKTVDQWVEQLISVSRARWSEHALFGNYVSMAQNNIRDYLQGERVRYKKYLYVLRPILCATHVLDHGTMPTMNFETLLASSPVAPEVRVAIEDLLQRKKAGEELEDCPASPVLNSYIEWSMKTLAVRAKERGAVGGWTEPKLPEQNDDLIGLITTGLAQYGLSW